MGAALALSLALYVVLRPENYGLTPNSLDPFFYSGYAINFDDVMNAVQDRHYFVSRWSAYYPGYIADALAGPFVGRLLLRLVLAAAILLSIWGMGRRWRWTRAQQLLIGVLVLTMPMFVRAFFTDYVEYMVVALGICLVAMCLRERQTALSAAISGALAALIVVANPIAITSIVLPLAVCVLLGGRRVRDKAFIAAVIAGAGAVVVMGGLVIFRWRYGIDNVYQPSIDFIRTYRGGDELQSPRLEWLWHFTWLFATPIVLVSAAGLAWRRSVRFERVEVVAFAMAGLQYLYQWLDQFVRDGNGLEMSYYWSFAYPTFAVAFALFVGRLTRAISSVPLVIGSLAWILFLLIGVPDAFRLPAGVGFAIVALVVVGGAVAVCRRSTIAAVSVVVVLVGWTQIGAPDYDPSAYALYNLDPYYDQPVPESRRHQRSGVPRGRVVRGADGHHHERCEHVVRGAGAMVVGDRRALRATRSRTHGASGPGDRAAEQRWHRRDSHRHSTDRGGPWSARRCRDHDRHVPEGLGRRITPPRRHACVGDGLSARRV